MCGRYSLTSDVSKLAQHFSLPAVPGQFALFERYNAAPTQPLPVVRVNLDSHQRELAVLNWGMVPSWAKDPSIGTRMINARSETLAEKPAFKKAFRRRRCLVPATGFYEWEKNPAKKSGPKQPYLIRMADEGLFAFAGLWDHWQSDEGSEIESFTIITTEANELLSRLHPRMPVIIEPADYDQWLAGEAADLAALLRPYPADAMMLHPVSTFVNDARHEGPRCLAPVTPDSAYYLRAQKVRTLVRRDGDRVFGEVDARLAPVTPDSAAANGADDDDEPPRGLFGAH